MIYAVRMEAFTHYFCEHAHSAHYVIFFLIVLTGLNIPFPEDILVMVAGMLVGTCIPESYTTMYMWVYAAAILSAYEGYFLGRLLGPKLYDIGYFRHVVTRHRVQRIGHWLEKYGVFTFIVGRFIPFGVRNGIFMTSGLNHMPFPRFAMRDAVGAFIATSVLFHLGHQFGQNYDALFHYFHTYELIVFVVAILIILVLFAIFLGRKWFSNNHNSD
jgi:membrane protein DedA with SNARE-associated domain